MTVTQSDLLPQQREALEHCRFCPMCKPKGEVSLVTYHEVHTTRARAMLLWRVVAGHADWTPELAGLVYEASLDSSSEQFCVGKIPVTKYIHAARVDIVRKGIAPEAVTRQAKRFENNPPSESAHRSPTAVYSDLDSLRPALSRFLPQGVAPIPLHELAHIYVLGLEDLYLARARSLFEAIRRSEAETVIVDGPASYYSLAVLLPRAGYPLTGVKVAMANEVLDQLGPTSGPPVHLHDSSYNRLGRLDPERLRSTLRKWGVEILEFAENGLLADDVGVEGALHLTHPELATKVALRRIRDLPRGSTILTDCPTSAAWLKRSIGSAMTVMLPDEYHGAYGG